MRIRVCPSLEKLEGSDVFRVSWTELTWSLDLPNRNFGDLCMREAAENLFDFQSLIEAGFVSGIFGGSALDSPQLDRFATFSPHKILMWGCGLKRPEVLFLPNNVKLLGVRGYLSAEHQEGAFVVGDPGLLSPCLLGIYPKAIEARRDVYLFPHFTAKSEDLISIETVSPMLEIAESSTKLLTKIAGAKFVLANSLHAGVFAYALGTPFAFYDMENDENDFKYADFLSILGIDVTFVKSLDEGIAWYLDSKISEKELDVSMVEGLLRPIEPYLKNSLEELIFRFKPWLETVNRSRKFSSNLL